MRFWGRAQLYAKAFVSFALVAVSWSVLIFAHPDVPLGALCLAGVMLGAILIGFCVQHDANHGAYFRSRRFNHLVGWTSDALLGFSSYAWRVKHNVAHHTYTNVDGYDDDINQTPFARLMPSQPQRPWYRLQHIYIWPLYSMMVIRWQTGRRHRRAREGPHRQQRRCARRRAGTWSGSSPARRSSSPGRS